MSVANHDSAAVIIAGEHADGRQYEFIHSSASPTCIIGELRFSPAVQPDTVETPAFITITGTDWESGTAEVCISTDEQTQDTIHLEVPDNSTISNRGIDSWKVQMLSAPVYYAVVQICQGNITAALDVLSQLGIPVYCIIGTHDHSAANPEHSGSVDGIAWLKEQVSDGNLTELSTTPTAVAGGPLDAYGVPAVNVGIDDVGNYDSRGWRPSDIAFGAASPGPNVLCLHDGMTPFREEDADVDLDRFLAQSRISFDCVLIGDEHHPKKYNFENGYSFRTSDGTPVFYTGPAVRIGNTYYDHDAFVTELSITETGVTATRHTV